MAKLGMNFPTKWGRGYIARLARHVIQSYIMGPYVRYLASLEVHGTENLNGQGPFIFAANHVSNVDAIILLTSMPRATRERTVVAAAMDSFFLHTFQAFRTVLFFNAIPVDRLKVNRKSAQLALELVEDHWNLLIFPEGGRTPDGNLQVFKGGAAYLAERSKAKVIPTYIHESGMLKGPKYAKAPIYVDAAYQRRHHVTVIFGEPLQCEDGENMRHFGIRIEEAVAALGRTISADPAYGRRNEPRN